MIILDRSSEANRFFRAQKVERAAELAREKLKWQKEREEENAQASGSGATPQSRM